MRDPFLFDPRSEACKRPFGAVECGKTISFRVRPLMRDGFSRCALLVRREFSCEEAEYPLAQEGMDGERVRFGTELSAPREAELLWYSFRFTRADGSERFYDRSGWNDGREADPFQITVYEKSVVPQWFGEGVTYQIFPDRYARLRVPSAEGLIGGRTVHEGWDEPLEWRPDKNGEVQNRDFFGGSLEGIAAHLDDLAAMGVETLYLNPIFTAASNHRYDTADYREIDPMLGTEDDFRALCEKARARGIRVILDGVFNHTGSRSRYFNADGFYPELGAAQSRSSPYFAWYSFSDWPNEYAAWWGVRTLPAVNEGCASYADFIVRGEDSVVRHWLRRGASGWRLDVADELPDGFLEAIRTAAEETDAEALVLGEVWEDASNKIAYSARRRYLLGRQLHGVMNYPFRTALLAYLRGGDADEFRETLETLREHYPRQAFYSLMNFLGTHDTPRALTVLGAEETPAEKESRAAFRLSEAERARGIARLKLAALVLFTFPGSPTVYYGDEAGMEGWEDPFCRGTYPWGREDAALKSWFSLLGSLRRTRKALRCGDFAWRYTAGPLLVFSREGDGERLTTVVNASDAPQALLLPCSDARVREDLLSGRPFSPENSVISLSLAPYEGLLLEECFT